MVVTSHQRRAAASDAVKLPAATSSTCWSWHKFTLSQSSSLDDLQRIADDGIIPARIGPVLARKGRAVVDSRGISRKNCVHDIPLPIQFRSQSYERRVVASVGKPVESLHFRLLGPLQLSRGGEVLKLPSSRKVRALLGYLVLASRPVARSQICELLWDVPNDPRGELRWCLSKIRGLVDENGHKRVIADGTSIRIDLGDCLVDTLEVTRAPEHGIQKLGVERQKALAAQFAGELLEGLEIARSPMFDAWITAERRRFRGIQTVLLENLSRSLPHEAAAPYIDEWLKLSPFDRQRPRAAAGLARAGRGASRKAKRIWPRPANYSRRTVSTARRCASCGAPRARNRPRSRSRVPRIELVSANLTEIRGFRPDAPASTRRASIAVMPFVDRSSEADKRGGAADALAYDVITRLAKLRSMFVIAQGSTFALRDRGDRARGSRAHAQRRLRGERLGAPQWPEVHRQRGTHRNPHRAHRVGGDVRREDRRRAATCSTRSATASSRRSRMKSRWSSAIARS